MAKTQETAVAKREDKVDETSLITQTKDGADAIADLWYQFARSGQHGSLEALRHFVNVAVPMQGGKDSRRRKLIDGAFAIADQAGAAPLVMARGAIRGMTSTYFDVVVNVNTNVGTNVEVLKGVDVTVPTTVKTFATH